MPTVDDFLNPDADGVLAKVEFLAMLKRLAGATVAGIGSLFVGHVVGVRLAVGGIVGDIMDAGGNIYSTLMSFPSTVQSEAVSAATGSLSSFGIFAGPASTATVLATLLLVGVVLYLFVGGGE